MSTRLSCPPSNRDGRRSERAERRLAAVAMTAAISLCAIAGQALAGQGEDSSSIRIRRGDLHPTTAAGAQQLLYRIEEAASQVCGASPFSIHELKLAVRRSDCWRKAVVDAVAQAGDPELSEALRREHKGWR